MRVQRGSRLMVGAVTGLIVLGASASGVSAYPPDDTPPSTTVRVGGVVEERPDPAADPADPTAQELPATGSDTGTLLWVAGVTVAGGAALLVTAKRRRPVAPS